MPKLYRKRVAKRKYGRRKSFRRSSKGKPSKAFTKKVKRAVDATAEHKFIGGTWSPTIDSTGLFNYFNLTLPQGTAVGNRVGVKTHNRSFKIRGWLQGADVSGAMTQVRMIVGVWHDYYSSTPTAAQLLEQPASLQPSFWTRQTLQARKWTPMYDRVFNIIPRVASQPIAKESLFNYSLSFSGKKLPKKDQMWNASGIPQDIIFMYIFSNYAGAAGSAPRASMDYRLTYTDV